MLLRTPDASEFLQVSESYLKRKRDTHGGYLENKKHYQYRGDSVNAAIIWDVELIQKELNKRGMNARQSAGVK